MKVSTKRWIKRQIPDALGIRQMLGAAKVRSYRRILLSSKEITAGEQDVSRRNEIAARQAERFPAEAKRIQKLTDEYFVHVPELAASPEVEQIRKDVLFHYFAYGFTPDEYFYFHIVEKTPEEKRTYISDLDHYILSYSLNDFVDIDVFYDKFRTYERFRPYFRREAICIEKERDRSSFLTFAKKHPIIVRKYVEMSRGHGVARIDLTGADLDAAFSEMISGGRQILEEPVVQSETMMHFHASSVNTVRIPTIRTVRGFELCPVRFRVGQGDSFVDNAGSGGIEVGVDRFTGVINTIGRDEYCREYPCNPETGEPFLGQQLPQWDQLVQMVLEMAEIMPNVGYVSWDMAHTDEGWVVIEGNGCGQFMGAQLVTQHGVKDEMEQQLKGVFSFYDTCRAEE